MMKKRKKKKKRGNFKPYDKSISTRSPRIIKLRYNFYFQIFTSNTTLHRREANTSTKMKKRTKRKKKEEISWIKSITHFKVIKFHFSSVKKYPWMESKDEKIDEERKRRRNKRKERKKRERETLKPALATSIWRILHPFSVTVDETWSTAGQRSRGGVRVYI